MMLGIPAIQLLLFGYAIRMDVRHLPTVVLDESRTPESRALVECMREHRQLRHRRRGDVARRDAHRASSAGGARGARDPAGLSCATSSAAAARRRR